MPLSKMRIDKFSCLGKNYNRLTLVSNGYSNGLTQFGRRGCIAGKAEFCLARRFRRQTFSRLPETLLFRRPNLDNLLQMNELRTATRLGSPATQNCQMTISPIIHTSLPGVRPWMTRPGAVPYSQPGSVRSRQRISTLRMHGSLY